MSVICSRRPVWAVLVLSLASFMGARGIVAGRWQEESSPQQQATQRGESSAKSLEDLRKTLAEGTEAEKRAAIEELAQRGPEAVPILVKSLDDQNDRVRAKAIQALGRLAPAHAELAVPRLFELALKDVADVEDWPNWILAFKAIGSFGKEALPHLEARWKDATPEIRASLCVAFAELGPAAAPAVPLLVELLEKDEDANRRQAVGALGAIGPAAAPAVPVLRKMLYHEDFHTQYWACRALGAIGDDALPAVPDLIDRLKNGAASVKRNAAMALGRLGPRIGREAIDALIAAVDDPLQPVREQAVLALGRLGPESAGYAREAIERSHSKRPIYPASAARWAVWRLGGSFEALQDTIISDIKEGSYLDEAIFVLKLMGPEARPVLEALKKAMPDKPASAQEAEARANIEAALSELQALPEPARQSASP